jgi:hypothetical protein
MRATPLLTTTTTGTTQTITATTQMRRCHRLRPPCLQCPLGCLCCPPWQARARRWVPPPPPTPPHPTPHPTPPTPPHPTPHTPPPPLLALPARGVRTPAAVVGVLVTPPLSQPPIRHAYSMACSGFMALGEAPTLHAVGAASGCDGPVCVCGVPRPLSHPYPHHPPCGTCCVGHALPAPDVYTWCCPLLPCRGVLPPWPRLARQGRARGQTVATSTRTNTRRIRALVCGPCVTCDL